MRPVHASPAWKYNPKIQWEPCYQTRIALEQYSHFGLGRTRPAIIVEHRDLREKVFKCYLTMSRPVGTKKTRTGAICDKKTLFHK